MSKLTEMRKNKSLSFKSILNNKKAKRHLTNAGGGLVLLTATTLGVFTGAGGFSESDQSKYVEPSYVSMPTSQHLAKGLTQKIIDRQNKVNNTQPSQYFADGVTQEMIDVYNEENQVLEMGTDISDITPNENLSMEEMASMEKEKLKKKTAERELQTSKELVFDLMIKEDKLDRETAKKLTKNIVEAVDIVFKNDPDKKDIIVAMYMLVKQESNFKTDQETIGKDKITGKQYEHSTGLTQIQVATLKDTFYLFNILEKKGRFDINNIDKLNKAKKKFAKNKHNDKALIEALKDPEFNLVVAAMIFANNAHKLENWNDFHGEENDEAVVAKMVNLGVSAPKPFVRILSILTSHNSGTALTNPSDYLPKLVELLGEVIEHKKDFVTKLEDGKLKLPKSYMAKK